MAYSDLLKDPKWQKKRLEILNRDQFTCTYCGDDDNMLTVHHKRYKKGAKPWEYTDDYLVTLCDDCHKNYHSEIDSSLIELCESFKKAGFFPKDILVIAGAVNGMEHCHAVEVIASVYADAISNLEIQKSLVDNFFVSLHDKNKAEF